MAAQQPNGRMVRRHHAGGILQPEVAVGSKPVGDAGGRVGSSHQAVQDLAADGFELRPRQPARSAGNRRAISFDLSGPPRVGVLQVVSAGAGRR